MRLVLSRWLLIILLTALIFSFPLGAVRAAENITRLDDVNPTPEIVSAFQADSDTAYGLIVGAAVIVLIIFAGVALRRQKS